MEPNTSQTARTDTESLLRGPISRQPELTIRNLEPISNPQVGERKNSDAMLSDLSSTCSITTSTHQPRPSQDVDTSATCPHLSPPHTPKAKPEWEYGVKLDWVPWIGPPGRKLSHSSDDLNIPKLPSVGDIFEPQRRTHGTDRPSGSSRFWPTPNSSPEPLIKEEDPCCAAPSASFDEEDAITRFLNAFRMESRGGRPHRPLPRLQGLGGNRLSRSMPRSPISRNKSRLEQQLLRYDQPPREFKKRARKRPSDDGHCNVKYVMEELDFIRYHRVERGMKWEELEDLFRIKFRNHSLPRTKQGIQGGYYRQNDGQVPMVTEDGQSLAYLHNGHVIPSRTKVRDQRDKKLFGLGVLFPERAMNYPWVDYETRKMAAKLGKSRHKPYSLSNHAELHTNTLDSRGT